MAALRKRMQCKFSFTFFVTVFFNDKITLAIRRSARAGTRSIWRGAAKLSKKTICHDRILYHFFLTKGRSNKKNITLFLLPPVEHKQMTATPQSLGEVLFLYREVPY